MVTLPLSNPNASCPTVASTTLMSPLSLQGTKALSLKYWLCRSPFLCLSILLGGCSPTLPDCVVGVAPSTTSLPPADQIEIAIDGSGSMLGFTGSPKASASLKTLLQSVNMAASSVGTPIRAVRGGNAQLQPITNVTQAVEPCFFAGCAPYVPMTSGFDVLWKDLDQAATSAPFKVLISELTVNDGEISYLVNAIKPHVQKGAAIGILAIKLPFEGNVFNNDGSILYTGEVQRPIYLLATGPRNQLQDYLNGVRQQAALAGLPTSAMRITFLDEHVNRPTLKAASVQGVPPAAISSGLPIRIGGSTYSPASVSEYQFARLGAQAEGVRLSSASTLGSANAELPDLGIGQLESVFGSLALDPGLTVKGLQLQGQHVVMELAIPNPSTAAAIRVTVPRGQLPEDWWIGWNRSDAAASDAKNQTEGLLPLLISLGILLVEPGATPAAAFCLAFS